MSQTVAVAFGGASNENEISVITGTMAANVLKSGGARVLPLYYSQSGELYAGDELADISTFKAGGYKSATRAIIADGGVYFLSKRGKIKKFTPVDCVLNCCHGGWGEGGGLAGVCAAAKLPLAGAGAFESAGFIDKYLTKIILQGLGVKFVPFSYIKSVEEIDSCGNMPEFPLIVKPATLGSSIGVVKAENAEELKEAVECALLYDSAVIVEKFIENRREINCAAIYADNKALVSECEEAVPSGELLSFEDKYKGGGKSVMPADIPQLTATYIKNTTRSVFEKLNMRGIVRFDYILSGDDVYLSEINTVPGSLAYYLFCGSFREFYKVLNAVIEQAEADFAAGRKKLLTTGILENMPSNACKSGAK